ncbi:MAG: flagellin [Gemmatimonadetes bacterium]|nr:flagellin [Gemmatimonadota bacterium]
MRINTNVSAINSQRMLNKSTSALSRSVARLSSGFRINRAADDAAGLGIANSLRGTIRGLEQASRNAEQANSLLQVAEGGAMQIEAILERMKQLSTQSASDNVNDTDRTLIQAEFTELQSEITRIVDTTKFLGNTLLNGSLGNSVDAANSTLDDAGTEVTSLVHSGALADTYTMAHDAVAETLTLTNSAGTLSQTIDITSDAGINSYNFTAFNISIETSSDFDSGVDTADGDIVVAGGNTSFLVSVSGDPAGQDAVAFGSLDLTLGTLGIDGDSLATKAQAVTAIGNIDTAIGAVSTGFGTIGAAQNRIEFAAANTDVALENFQAAESVIRDADMAAEVSELTKNQILQQAGTAMLAQANTLPQTVLALLQ